MSSDHVQLNASPRTEFGSAHTRRLRKQGLVPGVLYSAGEETVPFAIGQREIARALHGSHGKTAVFQISVDGGSSVPALLKDWELNPVRNELLHVDFQTVDLKVAVQVAIPVVLTGTAAGVREGGVLDQPLHEVMVEALPDALPDAIEVDVDGLDIGGVLHLSDLSAPNGVEILGDPETVIASVTAPSTVESADDGESDGVQAEPELVGESDSEE